MDFFKHKQEETNPEALQKKNQVRVERESVCMADDVNAPNTRFVEIEAGDRLSDLVRKIFLCLPKMKNVIWAVTLEKEAIAYIITNEDEEFSFELCREDQLLTETEIEKVYCRYFHKGRFFYQNGETGEVMEKYPECKTLLEKVKRHIEENG